MYGIIRYQIFIIQKSLSSDSLASGFLIINNLNKWSSKMFKRTITTSIVIASLFCPGLAVANETCEALTDPVAQFSCWIGGGDVVQPMGPGSGGTGGSGGGTEEVKKTAG
ncbi:hypothetical protein [Rheinheimera pleomorphica]|uniref:hypothetical protein n=1 Tax=Rheinheimera pleomorphica TaxID=2703963 RepID=UPI0014239017|nr:hypothetical protein [Rheinheimera pleomorphica]